MPELRITFNAEIVDEQRQLDGARYVALEGVDESGAWFLSLTYGYPKGQESALAEADMTLTGPSGTILAGLESGRTDIVNDDVGGGELETVDVLLQASAGEGEYDGFVGVLRLRCELVGSQGTVSVEATGEPSPD